MLDITRGSRLVWDLLWNPQLTCVLTRWITICTQKISQFYALLDIDRDNCFANILFSTCLDLQEEGEMILKLKAPPSIFCLVMSVRTCPRWEIDVGWKLWGLCGLISGTAHLILKLFITQVYLHWIFLHVFLNIYPVLFFCLPQDWMCYL